MTLYSLDILQYCKLHLKKAGKKLESLPRKGAADECKGSRTPRQLRLAAPRKY